MFEPQCGIFETMRAYGGEIFKLERHIERLYQSARTIGLEINYTPAQLKNLTLARLRESGLAEAVVRVSFNPDLEIILNRPKRHPDEYYRRGVKLATVVARRTIQGKAPQAKSNDYLAAVSARGETPEGIFEILFLNERGLVAEGSVSNIFVVKNNVLFTPPEWCGVLAGITREVVIETAEKLKLPFKEEVLTRHNLYNADEVFLTNTGIEIMPVREIDGRVIGDGKAGKITRLFMKEFKRITSHESRVTQ